MYLKWLRSRKKALFWQVGLALIVVLGAIALLQTPYATAIEEGVYLVEGNPSCADLNADPFFDNINSDFGFKIDGWDGYIFPTAGYPDYLAFTLTSGTQNGFTTQVTAGPEDPYNTVSIRSEDGSAVDWLASLGIDAVIVKGGPDANAYVYVPEAQEGSGLNAPGTADISHVEFCYDYELTAEKTANAEYTRTYSWDITKSVDPASHTGWFGDEFTSSYDVFVDQTVTDSDYKVTGEINISNPTPYTVGFTVEDYVDGVMATVTCPDDDFTLDPDETKICSYVAELGDTQPDDGTNTATISSDNPDVGGATAEAPYAFGDPTTVNGYETINVTDYFDGGTGEALGSASGDYTFEYDRTFACPTDESAYTDGVYTDSFPNYAEIDETGQQDDANVDLTCYKPVVMKDADTEWFEEYTWTITKSVDPDSHTGFPGDSFTSSYDVFVDQTVEEDGYRAFGNIYVTNPTGDAITVQVADAVNGTTATVDCDGAGSTSLTVGAGATESCEYSVDLNDNTDLTNTATVTYDGHTFEATADVIFGDPIIKGYPTINVTDYFDGDTTGDPLGSASGDYTFEYNRTVACPTDESLYTDGVYTDSFPNYAEIDETGQQDDANVDLTCYLEPEAMVVKTIDQGSEDIGQFPISFQLKDPGGTVVETVELSTADVTADGDYMLTFSYELTVEGTWTVEEILPDGWVSRSDQTCTFEVAFPASAGEMYTCTFDNVEKSRVDVLKLTNGMEDETMEWTFEIYEGPDGFGGTLVASDSTPPALLDFGLVNLDPLQTYTLCERNIPVGYTAVWYIDADGDGVGDTMVETYDPDMFEDMGNRCVDFGAGTDIPLAAGETLHFVVDNQQAEGSAPRTPGYWKNWSTCSNGNQAEVAAKLGGPEEGVYLLDDLLPQTIGGLTIEICEDGVLILDSRSLDEEEKMANDAAYNLARNLLATKLNLDAEACYPADWSGEYDGTTFASFNDLVAAADQLLLDVDFDGTGSYLGPKNKEDAALRAYALWLAGVLDDYNNALLCTGDPSH